MLLSAVLTYDRVVTWDRSREIRELGSSKCESPEAISETSAEKYMMPARGKIRHKRWPVFTAMKSRNSRFPKRLENYYKCCKNFGRYLILDKRHRR